jgi:hypothetical protein
MNGEKKNSSPLFELESRRFNSLQRVITRYSDTDGKCHVTGVKGTNMNTEPSGYSCRGVAEGSRLHNRAMLTLVAHGHIYMALQQVYTTAI